MRFRFVLYMVWFWIAAATAVRGNAMAFGLSIVAACAVIVSAIRYPR